AISSQHRAPRICLRCMPTTFHLDNQRQADLTYSVLSSHYTEVLEYQPISHRLRLSASPEGSTHPAPINVGLEPLAFQRTGFSPVLSLLTSAFALLIPPADFSIHLHRLTERSPTTYA